MMGESRSQDSTGRHGGESVYRRIFDAVGGGLAIIQGGCVRLCNPWLCNALGHAADDLFGRELHELLHPESGKALAVCSDDVSPAAEQTRCFRTVLFRTADGGSLRLKLIESECHWDGEPARLLLLTKNDGAAPGRDETLRSLFKNAPLGIFQTTPEGRYLDANNYLAAMYGYDSVEQLLDEVSSITEQIYADPADRRRLVELLEKHDEVFQFESIRKKRDGEVICTATNMRAVRNESGRIDHLDGFTWDITDNKRAEEALRESEERFRTMIEGAPDAIFIQTEQRFAYLNHKAIEVLGADDPEQLLGANVLDRVHPDFHAHAWERIRQINEDRIPVTAAMEQKFIRLDGGEIWLETTGQPIVYQGKAGALVFARDISTRKRTEAALIRSEHKYHYLFENAGEGMFLGDADANITEANPMAASVLGYSSPDMLIGINARDIVHPDDLAGLNLEKSWEIARPDGTVQLERRFRKADGSYLPVMLTKRMLPEVGPGQHYVTFRDISERARKERADKAAREKAEAASKAKSDFLANMSHEMRTPLNGIMGMLQLLHRTVQSAEQEDLTDTALESCRRLSQLLGDILDLSKVEAGRVTFRRELFDVREILNAVEKLFAPPATQAGLALRFHVDPRAPAMLSGDESRLHQILNNLVGNAIKFTNEGSISVDVSLLPGGDTETCRLLFVISDTGVGIDDDMLNDLFNPFTQAESSLTRRHQGAGLGLSIVKRLVANMGGSISVDSTPGQGTSFYISLPFGVGKGEYRVRPKTEEVETQEAPSSLRVLVAEDDRTCTIALVKMLENMGAAVQVAGDGEQVLETLRSRDRFDVVLMDIQMPVMDGMEAARAIRDGQAGAECADIPIVALTAYAMSGDREVFIEAGMDDCLTKPIEMNQLATILARAARGAIRAADE
ncbi:hypothetical protein DQK91_01355 [Oceanidesulfovibrio marinus]|uniref:histidine kinase n=2 Tax=Oceanidesulfovibrio marinus TaxID=370038 RepID=A0A6P1ZPX5_9BACT|nr:hypothetical protein DQK91_01355 [Oceanidesulfovibrio marinus]